MKSRFILGPALGLLLTGLAHAQDSFPLPAHSHDDFLQERPLFHALGQGFASIEVDIHLVDGELLVAQDADEVVRGRTFTSLYLEPLRLMTQVYGGNVYGGVDVRSDAEATYRQLQRVLAPYEPLLTRFTADSTTPGAITVVVSGNVARELMASETERFAAYDGSLQDLEGGSPDRHLSPIISRNWSEEFSWDGRGIMPAAERERLQALCQVAHDAGILLRFQETPDEPSVWQVLRGAGAGLISTDRVEALGYFLRN